MLPRLVGVTRANDLLLSGRVVTGAETADWGLWNGVEPDGDATLAAARRYGRLVADTVGPNAVTMTKRQIADDLLRHDPAASVADSLRLLDERWAPPSTARASAPSPRNAPQPSER